jgi:hypothetical protein
MAIESDKQRSLYGDEITRMAFSVFENKGIFALLLGSGLSRAASIPTGWEITLDLIRRVALAKGVAEQLDWGRWFEEETKRTPHYSQIIEELASSPDERRAILQGYIEPSQEDLENGKKMPTKAHYAIAELVRDGYLKVIVTTNFDRLIENALRERDVEPTVISAPDFLAGAEPISHSKCYLLKLHGDYKDSRILNTDAELSEYPAQYNQLLDRIFDEYGLIVSGWSGEWDIALRSALLRAANRRYSVYWTSRSEMADSAQTLVRHRNARIVSIADADSFFTQLQQKVEILGETRVQNPASIDLLIRSAKQFLPKPEHRIRLDDMVSMEAERTLALIREISSTRIPSFTSGEFARRVNLLEAATEPLGRLAGVIGRWGTSDELPMVLEVIKVIANEAEKPQNGVNFMPALRSYPAVLIFSAYGVGLTRSDKLQTLFKLFSAPIPNPHGPPKRIVNKLFLWDWAGNDQALFQTLPGLDRRHTPLSDHLCELMRMWSSSFVGVSSDFEDLFGRFELLGSLADLGGHTEAEVTAELQRSTREAVRMSVGRLGWNSERRSRLLAELKSPEQQANLLKAGFANGSPTFLDLLDKNIQRISSMMGWWH